MNTVAQKHQSLKKSVIAASVVIIAGLLLASAPYIAKIPMQWTGFILLALGSILFVLGFVARGSLQSMQMAMQNIVTPEDILLRWTNEDTGEVILSKRGIYYDSSIYLCDGNSSFFKKVEFSKEGVLSVTTLYKIKKRRHSVELNIQVPRSEIGSVAKAVDFYKKQVKETGED
jgi:hypothetical protein